MEVLVIWPSINGNTVNRRCGTVFVEVAVDGVVQHTPVVVVEVEVTVQIYIRVLENV